MSEILLLKRLCLFPETATELLPTHPPFVVLAVQRQAQELILALTWLQGPNYCPLIGHNPQSKVMIHLLTGHSTLRRYLYVMGLSNNPSCRKCGTEEETSVHILCECEALASLRHTHLGSFFLDPQDIRKLNIGAIWNFAEGTGLL
jgi:hypothetical protein